MKNRFALLALAAVTLAGSAFADIQSPSGHHYNWSRKLSRGVSNIFFPLTFPGEYINRWRYTNPESGTVGAASDMLIEGTRRSVVRIFYGVYEVATFPFPSWKGTYRPPYYRKEYVDSWWGYTEFPQDIGQLTQTTYSRRQGW